MDGGSKEELAARTEIGRGVGGARWTDYEIGEMLDCVGGEGGGGGGGVGGRRR